MYLERTPIRAAAADAGSRRQSQVRLSVPAPGSRDMVTMLLTPLMALAFALVHIIYQTVVTWRRIKASLQARARRANSPAPASVTCLEDLVAHSGTRADAIRTPKHMAVVLANPAPSLIRLYLSTLLMRLARGRRSKAESEDLWGEFRKEYQAAVERKHVGDTATLIHLARVCGVNQLSVYTEQPLSRAALAALSNTLQAGFKTKVVFAHQQEQVREGSNGRDADTSWSHYAELGRRKKGSDSSGPSSRGSAESSSDSEAGSSLDETLASSYTAEHDETLQATAHIGIGLGRDSPAISTEPSASATSIDAVAKSIKVDLLSSHDGHARFAAMVSTHVRTRSSHYLTSTLLPAISSAVSNLAHRRFSASTLRKSWVSPRQTLTWQLTVKELDRVLGEAGYLGEPELMVVLGGQRRVRKLYGFPAWAVRLTDLFFDPLMQPNQPYGTADFVAALRKLAKTQHRYGR